MSAVENKRMGTIFIGFGSFMLITAAVSVWSTLQFIKSAHQAEGIVKELNHGSAHPQIEFQLPSGEKQEFSTSGWIFYKKGQRAKVLYTLDERGIDEARLDDRGDLWYSAVSDTGLGLVFLILGAVLRWRFGMS